MREAFGARRRLSPWDGGRARLASPPVGPLFFLLFGLCPQCALGETPAGRSQCHIATGMSLRPGSLPGDWDWREREGSGELEMGGGRVSVEERDVEAEGERG